MGLYAYDPIADVEVAEADVEGGQQREITSPGDGAPIPLDKPLDVIAVAEPDLAGAYLDALLRPDAINAGAVEPARSPEDRPGINRDQQPPSPKMISSARPG
jgi:hypothetical protein